MTADIADQKRVARTAARSRLAGIPRAELADRSARAVGVLVDSDIWARAETVMLYLPLPGEVDLTGCMADADGKRFAAPRAEWNARMMEACEISPRLDGVVAGRHGVREPGPGSAVVPAESIDLVLVPGLAFDARGGRLGRGAGFYDRFLARLTEQSPEVVVCGVCFTEQMVASVPMEPRDVRVRMLLTDEGLRSVAG